MATEHDVFTEITSREAIEVPCDWSDQPIHQGEGGARWVATLVVCICGRTGVRLICDHCKDMVVHAEDAAMCGTCGEVYVPFRNIVSYLVLL